MPKMCIEIPQPTKRAPIVVDLEGNSDASIVGMNVAAARDVLDVFIGTAALKGRGRSVSGRDSLERISMLLSIRHLPTRTTFVS